MKRNILPALFLLLLGAALAEWLSTDEAHAQALPPSTGGGTSYTHPSAISLSNGIDSQDGGTFRGPVKVGIDSNNPGLAPSMTVQVQDAVTATIPLMVQGRAGIGGATIGYAPTPAASYAGYMEYSNTVAGCWGLSRSGGYGSSLILCPYLGSGDTMGIISGHPTASSYGVRIQSYNGSALETAFETVGGWPKIPKENAGAPAGTDCDVASEAGRIVFDTTNFREYRCFGTAGWKYSQML